MKKKMKRFLALVLTMVCFMNVSNVSVLAAGGSASIYYRTHCQNIGWTGYSYNGQTSGTEGQSLRVEAAQIGISGMSGEVLYRTHCQNIGWTGWSRNGQTSGTEGQSLRVEAVQIMLSGAIAEKYDVLYRTHCQNIGWTGWSKNGQTSGTEGQSLRVEAIQIKLVAKATNTSASNTSGGYVINGVNIGYKAGDYFTDNKKACTDHGTKGIHSYNDESACNCICTYNGKSLKSTQCLGFARYVQSKLYGVNSGSDEKQFYQISGSSVAAGKLTAAKLKTLITSAKVGAHIRTGESKHSMIITNITDNGFSIIQCNGSNNNEYEKAQACRIGTYTYTWSSYVNSTYGKRGLSFIEVKK